MNRVMVPSINEKIEKLFIIHIPPVNDLRLQYSFQT